jgi:hypothetical protein
VRGAIYPELDDTPGITDRCADTLADVRTGKNSRPHWSVCYANRCLGGSPENGNTATARNPGDVG